MLNGKSPKHVIIDELAESFRMECEAMLKAVWREVAREVITSIVGPVGLLQSFAKLGAATRLAGSRIDTFQVDFAVHQQHWDRSHVTQELSSFRRAQRYPIAGGSTRPDTPACSVVAPLARVYLEQAGRPFAVHPAGRPVLVAMVAPVRFVRQQPGALGHPEAVGRGPKRQKYGGLKKWTK